MDVFGSSAYCLIGSLKPACAPTRRISRLTTVASTGRLMKISVKLMGLLLRQLRRRTERARIVDLDGGAGLQFELAAGDHLFSGFHAFEDRYTVALRRANAHEAALDDKLWLGGNRSRGRDIGGDGRGDRLARCRRRRRRLWHALLHHPYAVAV